MNEAPRATARPVIRWALLVFLIAATVGFIALGVWQVERLQWKRDLIARVDARVHATPAQLPASSFRSALDPAEDEYRRITATGRLLHTQEVAVYATTERGPGYWIMTPLMTADGTVWINRGYVDNAHRARETRARHDESETVSVTGLLRVPEQHGVFLRANVPDEDRWYTRAPAEFSAARNIDGAIAPFFIDAQDRIDTGNWPVPGLTMVQFRNNHFSYALTWFGMALLGLLATGFVLRSEFRRKR